MTARTSKTLGLRKAPQRRAPQPRGRPPLDNAERKRILDATTAVFLEKGFAHASTSEIAKRARTSKQTLYALFPTKADLFVSVIGAHTDQLFASHAYYIESGKTPRQALTEIGHMVLKMFSAPEFLALYRIVVAEAHNFPDLARQLWRECTERGYDLLADYLKSRRIGGPGYKKSAAKFVSFVLGDFVLNQMLNPDRRKSERALNAGVQQAVEDFLRLHPARELRK
jgi:TetR/AcrR family transcriptional regulator, mexJK operon transcriptional repressor